MKFSIVTPVYNGEAHITETIESVLSQEGDFEIEYIIQDGGSSDKTIEIVRSYAERLITKQYLISCKNISLLWFSEKDNGMYDATEKGFSRATGDVYAYINADDKYLPGALAIVSKIFSTYPNIEWVKGINTTSDEKGTIISPGACFLYRREWLQKGIYGRSAYFVQQDSVFWKRSLWERGHPTLANFRLAGDYALWVNFAKHTQLWSFNKRVSIFRKRQGQLSTDMEAYNKEQEIISPRSFLTDKRILLFFILGRLLKLDPKKIGSRLLFFTLFPFLKQEWYIDFNPQGEPIKKRATSYLV